MEDLCFFFFSYIYITLYFVFVMDLLPCTERGGSSHLSPSLSQRFDSALADTPVCKNSRQRFFFFISFFFLAGIHRADRVPSSPCAPKCNIRIAFGVMYTRANTNTHIHTHARTYTYTQTYTHTHTRAERKTVYMYIAAAISWKISATEYECSR